MALDLRPASTIARDILARAPTREAATAALEAEIRGGTLGFEQAKAVDAAIDIELKKLSSTEQQRVGTQSYGAQGSTVSVADAQRSFTTSTRGWLKVGDQGPPEGQGELRGRKLAVLLAFDPPGGGSRFVETTVLRAPNKDDDRWFLRMDSGWVEFIKPDSRITEMRLEPSAPKGQLAFEKKYTAPDWTDLPLDPVLPQLADQRTTPLPGDRIALYSRHGRAEQRIEGTLVAVPRYPRENERNEDTLCWQLKASDGSIVKVPRDDVLGVRTSNKERNAFEQATQGWAEGVDELKIPKQQLVGKRVKVLMRDASNDHRLKTLDATVERPAVYGREADYLLKLKDGSTLSVSILDLLKMRLAPGA